MYKQNNQSLFPISGQAKLHVTQWIAPCINEAVIQVPKFTCPLALAMFCLIMYRVQTTGC